MSGYRAHCNQCTGLYFLLVAFEFCSYIVRSRNQNIEQGHTDGLTDKLTDRPTDDPRTDVIKEWAGKLRQVDS